MWLAKPLFKSLFRDKFDPAAYGGAPLLGLNHVAIVCHGSSNERAIMNGLCVAQNFVGVDLVPKIAEALYALDSKNSGVIEDGMWDRVGQRFEKRPSKKTDAPNTQEEKHDKGT